MGAVTCLAGWTAHVAVTAMVGVGLGVVVAVGRGVSLGWLVGMSPDEMVGVYRLSIPGLMVGGMLEQAVNKHPIQTRRSSNRMFPQLVIARFYYGITSYGFQAIQNVIAMR